MYKTRVVKRCWDIKIPELAYVFNSKKYIWEIDVKNAIGNELHICPVIMQDNLIKIPKDTDYRKVYAVLTLLLQLDYMKYLFGQIEFLNHSGKVICCRNAVYRREEWSTVARIKAKPESKEVFL